MLKTYAEDFANDIINQVKCWRHYNAEYNNAEDLANHIINQVKCWRHYNAEDIMPKT